MTDKQRFIDFANLMGHKVLEAKWGLIEFVYFTDKQVAENVHTWGYDYIEFFGVFEEDGSKVRIYNISHVSFELPGYSEYIKTFANLCPEYINQTC